MYTSFSKSLNELINLYFRAERDEDMEIKIAGDAVERSQMMPLLYIDDCEETKSQVRDDMLRVLHQFHDDEKANTILNPANRMKPLDVVKVLMGIRSSRESVKRFQYDGQNWAKLHEHDYEQLMNLAEDVVNQFYVDALGQATRRGPEATAKEGVIMKKRKLN